MKMEKKRRKKNRISSLDLPLQLLTDDVLAGGLSVSASTLGRLLVSESNESSLTTPPLITALETVMNEKKYD